MISAPSSAVSVSRSALCELDLSTLHTVSREREPFHQTAQAWIARECANEKLGLRQSVNRFLNVRQRFEQETVMLKKISTVRLNDRAEQIRAFCEVPFQCICGLLDIFRRRCRDDY